MSSDRTKERKGRTAANHILAVCMFVALLFFRPVNSQQMLAASIHFEREAEVQPRTLIIAVYEDIVDDRYIILDYLGSLLRGLDINNTDTILINNTLEQIDKDKLFDKAILEYLSNGNTYATIISLDTKSMDYAVDAKHLYYPDTNVLCFGQCSKEVTPMKYVCENTDITVVELDDYNIDEHTNRIDNTIESALILNENKTSVIILRDDSEYSINTAQMIKANEKLSDMDIQTININGSSTQPIDFCDSLVFMTAYPDNSSEVGACPCEFTIAGCFDCSEIAAKDGG